VLLVRELSTTAERGGTRLRLLARAERPRDPGGVVSALTLEVWLRPLEAGSVAGALEDARCTVRYLDEGRQNEVDLGLVEATGQVAPGGRLELIARCQKRFLTTTGGRPHAPRLPHELSLSVSVLFD
jgi:hypothetical protein